MTPAATKLVRATILRQSLMCRFWVVWGLLRLMEIVWPYKVSINIHLREQRR